MLKNNKILVIINDENYEAEEIIAHEGYISDKSDELYDIGLNDIMLIKLKEPLVFSENVSSICLLQNLTVPAMEVAAAAGFGVRFIRVINLNDTFQDEFLNSNETIFEGNDLLRETPLLIRDLEYCGILDITEENGSTLVCAGGANHGTTPGDSGGPLLVVRDHRWVQHGITAYGSVMPIAGDLLAVSDIGVYTKISAFCGWIAEKTSNEVTCQ
uniref:Peptidase S1 domain-containing protein n=1 Tax=Panagrolaimus superbus TaxID=310955 RepID=A0A914Z406_9BILA